MRIFYVFLSILVPALLISCIAPAAPDNMMPHNGAVVPAYGQADIYDLSYLKDKNPAEVDNSNLPVTPTERLSLTGKAPESVDIDKYRITVSGMVSNTLDLTWQDVISMPSITRVVLLICHEAHVDNARWTGVPVSALLDRAGILDDASSVTFIALDRYSHTLPLDVARQEGTFVAFQVNGEAIPLKHGYPLRLVAQGQYGENWVKWLRQIDVQ